MKNNIITVIGLMFFSSVISLISPDKNNTRLINIVIICYVFFVLSSGFKGSFSNAFTDCRSMYDSMLNKIEDITEENNKLMTELSKGMK